MISSLIEHAARFHPHTEIVSRLPETRDGGLHRTDWAGMRRASCQVANALQSLGVQPGERVGTLAWNSWRHLALYFGVSGSGAVLHIASPEGESTSLVVFSASATNSIRLCVSVDAFMNRHAEGLTITDIIDGLDDCGSDSTSDSSD